MKKRLLSLALVLLLAAACSKKKNDHQQQYDSCKQFAMYLKADMNYSAIVSTFGAPAGDLGSGIHIYVYPLEDGSAVWIGYTDHIMYARHMNSNKGFLHNII